MIRFSWTAEHISRLKTLDRALFRTLSRSGGDAIRALRTASTRAVRARKRLKLKFLNDSMKLEFPRGRDINDLAWTLNVSGKPIPVAAYPHRQTSQGVSVAINTSGRKLIRSAFIAGMASGHVGVFKREGTSRLPIKELFSSRVTDVFNDTGMIPTVSAKATSVFAAAFDRLMKLEMEKLK